MQRRPLHMGALDATPGLKRPSTDLLEDSSYDRLSHPPAAASAAGSCTTTSPLTTPATSLSRRPQAAASLAADTRLARAPGAPLAHSR